MAFSLASALRYILKSLEAHKALILRRFHEALRPATKREREKKKEQQERQLQRESINFGPSKRGA